MREIKFRSWDNINKKWLLGYELPNLGGFSMWGECMLFGEYSAVLSDFVNKGLNELIVMQFTGKKDCKGVEVYEDDIVKGSMGIYLVKWNDDYAAFALEHIETNETKWASLLNFPAINPLEVIGNIHEHPHLLTQPSNQ